MVTVVTAVWAVTILVAMAMSGNIDHAFSGHSFGGHFAERMNAGGGFTGFSKGSISMSDHPIADNTTRSISERWCRY